MKIKIFVYSILFLWIFWLLEVNLRPILQISHETAVQTSIAINFLYIFLNLGGAFFSVTKKKKHTFKI